MELSEVLTLFFVIKKKYIMSSRDRILEKIKATRIAKNKHLSPTVEPIASGLKVPEGDLVKAFKTSMELVQGECYLSDNQDECCSLVQKYIAKNADKSKVCLSPSLQHSVFASLQTASMKGIQVGVSSCELLVAQTGTALVTSKEGRRIIGLSPIHIIIAERSQLRRTLDEGVKELASKYGQDLPSQLTLITGPSRTADIEKTLILGAHGPKRLAVFIY